MMYQSMYRKAPIFCRLVFTLVVLSLTACFQDEENPAPDDDENVTQISLKGIAVKGPIRGATVTAYHLLPDGSYGQVAASGETDNNGEFALLLDANGASNVALVVTGGEYTDEATDNVVKLRKRNQLESFIRITGLDEFANITPLTTLAAARVRQRIADVGETLEDAITLSNVEISELFHTGNIESMFIPKLDQLETADSLQRNYALILAGFSQLDANDASENVFEILDAMVADIAADGVLGNDGNARTPIQLIAATNEFLSGKTELNGFALSDELVSSFNSAPAAQNDSVTLDEDTSVDIYVLANDTDENGDQLSVKSVDVASITGDVTINANGTLTYAAYDNFHGQETFSYTIADQYGAEDQAQVVVTVSPSNDVPLAKDGSFTTVGENRTVDGVLEGSDVDGDVLQFSIVAQPTKGAVEITNQETGAFTYIANADAEGDDSFSFVANDGKIDSNTAVVQVTLNTIPGHKVEILRDTYGVPHIYGDTDEAVMYGFGWAQAEDHVPLMSVFYLEANGLLAQTFAGDIPITPLVETQSQLINSDRVVRMTRMASDPQELWPQINAEDPASWDASTSAMITAFAAGINDWVEQNREQLPVWIPEYTPQGTLAMARHIFVQRQTVVLQGKQPALKPEFELLAYASGDPSWQGSNQFVTAPSKADNGSVRVLSAPHLPFYGHYNWYEAHLSGGGFDVAGATLYGMPVIAMAHSEKIAYSMTSNSADNADLFEIDVSQADATKYVVDGESHSFQFASDTVTLKDGSTKTYRWAYANLNGFDCPVVGPLETHEFTPGSKVTVGCMTKLGDPYGITQMWKMNRAESIDEFKIAVEGRHMAMWNMVAGDSQGNIFYFCNSRHPRRQSSIDWHQVIDGSSSTNHWQGLLEFSELPQAENSSSGFYQNCNNSPYWLTDTFAGEIDMSKFPRDLCAHSEARGERPERMTDLLVAKEKHSFEELQDISLDVYMLHAEEYVPRLAVWAQGLAESADDPEAVRRGVAILAEQNWDYRADKDSTETYLFIKWLQKVKHVIGSIPRPLPPDTEISNSTKVDALNWLAEIVVELEAAHGTAAIAYGNVHRIRRGGLDMPVGGEGNVVATLHLNVTGTFEGNVGYADGGSSYLKIAELHPEKGVKAVSMKPWGQSDRPLSPHYNDLTLLYAQEQYKPFWFYRKDVEANLSSQLTLTYSPSIEVNP